MNTQAEQREWFMKTVGSNAVMTSGASLPWLDKARAQARHALASVSLPDRKQEAWRYADLGRLYRDDYHFQADALTALQQRDLDRWIYSRDASHRLVFVNGRFVPGLSTDHELRHGVRIGSLRDALASSPALLSHWLAQSAWHQADAFAELNRALINDGVFIHVPENAVIDKPVEIVYLNTSLEKPALCQPHSVVALEPGAQARIIERFTGTAPASYFFNGITSIVLGSNARLQHYRLQHESASAHHLSRVAVRQAAASEYDGVTVATGGAWSRTEVNARFDGPRAVCNLDGLYTVGEQQYNDVHLDVVHNLPQCTSRENFKGIVFGKGRAVFDGRILVEKDAQKTDAQLSNRNLLLTPFAEVDTKPQLEIHADDVKCSHGTTVGKLDPNQLFYLRSRGIGEREARRMICLGFAEQVLAKIEDQQVHGFVRDQIAGIFERQDNLR